MVIDVSKFDSILARKCMNLTDLRKDFSSTTLTSIRKGREIRPKTAGRIAKALGVDISEIVSEEGRR